MALRSSTDRVCLLDIETTYGVAATMTAADAIVFMDSDIQPAADKLERSIDRPYFGGNPFVLVGKSITLSGTIDLLGSATAGLAAPLGKVYRACCHAETLTALTNSIYNPISRSIESATIDFYWAGVRFRMLGARGTLDMDFSIKSYAKGTINLTGLLVLPQDGEAPGPIDWSAFQTPPAVESETWEVIVDGVNVCAQQLTMTQNGTIVLTECSEGREVIVTDRVPTGVLRVYKDTTLAIWNPWAIADAQEIVLLENTVTKGAGLNCSVPMNVQLEYPKPIDIEGVAGFEIPFTVIPVDGDDEYTMTFT